MFFVFLTIFIISGVFLSLNYKRDALLLVALIGFSIIPSGPAFEHLVMRWGIYAFMGLPIGICLVGLFRSAINCRVPKLFLLPSILFIVAIFFFFFNSSKDINTYRDLRVFALFLVCVYSVVLLAKNLEKTDVFLIVRSFRWAVYVAFFKTFSLWIAVRFFDLNTKLTNDPFLAQDPRATQWYSDVSIFISLSWLLCFSKRSAIVDLLAICTIFLSGNRTLLIVSALIYLIDFKFSRGRFLALFFGVVASGWLIYERINESNVLSALANRFYPAQKAFQSMRPIDAVFGLGFGYSFEIPWFNYRQLDSSLNFIDNFYLTLFAKFGLFSLLIIFLLYKSIMSNLGGRKRFFIFFALMGLTTSLIFQSSFPVFIFILCFAYQISSNQPQDRCKV